MNDPRSDEFKHVEGNEEQEKVSMFCGEPIWPKSLNPYRVEFSLSCGWVLVDQDGRESTLGYVRRADAADAAALMTVAYEDCARRHGASRAFGDGDYTDPEWGDNQTRNPPDGDDRCRQCGKRCPNATCPACQEKNVRAQNDAETRSL